MPRYLISIHRPENYDPCIEEDDVMHREIDELNEKMNLEKIVVFVGGLQSPRLAKSVRISAGGKVEVDEGPYLKCSEQVGGFWVIDVASMDQALYWAKQASTACRAPVETRPFH